MADPFLRFMFLTFILAVPPTIFMAIVLPENLKPLVIVYVTLVVIVLIRYLYGKVLYECPKCGHTFKPNFSDFVLSPHQTYYKLLRCPKCKSVEWCVVRYYGGERVEIKLKPIKMEGKANLKLHLAFTTVLYVLCILPSLLKSDPVLFMAATVIYLIYLTTVVHAMRRGYESQIFYAMTFFTAVSMIILTFIGFAT